MRLRRISEAKKAVTESELCLKEPLDMHGKWRAMAAGKPIFLEIGMGRGAFIIGHALYEKDKFFLGLEFREEMLFIAEKKLKSEMALKGIFELPGNLRLLWLNAILLPELFADNEIDALYLNFSDPWPKARHEKRRLTHNDFLEQYQRILAPGGKIFLRTDNADFFNWSMRSFAASKFIKLAADSNAPLPEDNIISEYEARYRSKDNPIYTACFQKGE